MRVTSRSMIRAYESTCELALDTFKSGTVAPSATASDGYGPPLAPKRFVMKRRASNNKYQSWSPSSDPGWDEKASGYFRRGR